MIAADRMDSHKFSLKSTQDLNECIEPPTGHHNNDAVGNQTATSANSNEFSDDDELTVQRECHFFSYLC